MKLVKLHIINLSGLWIKYANNDITFQGYLYLIKLIGTYFHIKIHVYQIYNILCKSPIGGIKY